MNYPQYSLLSGALISSVTGLLHNRIMTPNIQEYLSLTQDLQVVDLSLKPRREHRNENKKQQQHFIHALFYIISKMGKGLKMFNKIYV